MLKSWQTFTTLTLCWVNAFKNIACYSDSLQVVDLIRDGVSPYHKYMNEIQSCHMLSRDWNIVIDHTFWKGNTFADVLAKMGTLANSPLMALEEPPS
ncbi:ribonuclease H [Trifolium pratense]|uniref:Ribonuclease H n=1 Tax=Trifolium pratense TaxID=57577 RepID=A0A2K3MDF4_TRIPR|nr:ribonuclease H [Trifolium pratense]